MVQKYLITLYFDAKDELELEHRDYDMFMMQFEEGAFKEKIFEVFVKKGYAWNDFNRAKGHKDILSIEHVDLSNLEVY